MKDLLELIVIIVAAGVLAGVGAALFLALAL